MKYRKKPVVIGAVLYLGKGNVEGHLTPEWFWDALKDRRLTFTNGLDPLTVHTMAGEMTVSPGDWVIREVNGEIYPCKPDIFEAIYEPV